MPPPFRTKASLSVCRFLHVYSNITTAQIPPTITYHPQVLINPVLVLWTSNLQVQVIFGLDQVWRRNPILILQVWRG